MRSPDTPDCAIRGCTRAQRTGLLCAEHYKLVPLDLKMEASMRGLEAQLRAVGRVHQLQLAAVRKQLA